MLSNAAGRYRLGIYNDAGYTVWSPVRRLLKAAQIIQSIHASQYIFFVPAPQKNAAQAPNIRAINAPKQPIEILLLFAYLVE